DTEVDDRDRRRLDAGVLDLIPELRELRLVRPLLAVRVAGHLDPGVRRDRLDGRVVGERQELSARELGRRAVEDRKTVRDSLRLARTRSDRCTNAVHGLAGARARLDDDPELG